MNNNLGLIALICAILALILALAGFLPINYDELENIPNIDLVHGLCLWLPFDGVALDRSGYGLDSSLSGGFSYVAGYFDRALSVDGVNGKAEVADNDVLDMTSVMTISFWFKPDGFIYNKGLLGKRTSVGSPSWFIITLDNGNLEFNVWNSSLSECFVVTDEALNNNVWSHVVLVVNGTAAFFVLNGVVNSNSVFVSSIYSGTSAIRVGTYYDNEYVDGVLDDVRIYNRVLSDYEIEHLFNLGA